jgi:hypothetical protein
MVAVGAETHLGLGVSQRTRTYILSYGAEADHVETSPIPSARDVLLEEAKL